MLEESGLCVSDLDKVGVMLFEFVNEPQLMEVHVFRTWHYEGEPQETEGGELIVTARHVLPPLPWSSKFCLIFPRSSCLREPYFFHQTLWLLFFSLLSFVRLLFECGIYSSEGCRHQWQLDKVRMSDIVTTVRHCQCVQPMSGLEMSCTTRTALAQWLSSEIFAYVYMCPLYQLQLLFKYHTYFAQSFWLCDFYPRAVFIRRNTVFLAHTLSFLSTWRHAFYTHLFLLKQPWLLYSSGVGTNFVLGGPRCVGRGGPKQHTV